MVFGLLVTPHASPWQVDPVGPVKSNVAVPSTVVLGAILLKSIE
jgi:hypothetical protein